MTIDTVSSMYCQPDSNLATRLSVEVRNHPDIVNAYGWHFAVRAVRALSASVAEAFGQGSTSLRADGLRRFIDIDLPVAEKEIGARVEALLVALASEPVVIEGVAVLLALCVSSECSQTYSPADRIVGFVFREHMEKAVAAHEALRSGRLTFEFEPVRAVDAESVLYWEALARMIPSDGSNQLISPGAFIPSLETLGLTRIFDRHVVLMAIDALHTNPAVRIGCNISALSAVDDEYWQSVYTALAERPHVASRLVIEITETASIPNLWLAQSFASCLKQLGCQVALDDFGAGHTSIAQAVALRPDVIKIDRSCLRESRSQVFGCELFVRLIQLCAHLAAQVVVEGVEDEHDVSFAHLSGVRWVQGYHIAASVARTPSNFGGSQP